MTDISTETQTTTRDIKINIRAMKRQRELIDQAATIIGKNRSDFMLEAAIQKAEDILLDRLFFFLPPKQWDEFLSVLDAPVKPNEKLKKLLSDIGPWEI